MPGPVDVVADVLNDIPRWPEWMGISEITVEGGQRRGPLEVGTRYEDRVGLIKGQFEVVDSDPPRRTRVRCVSGGLPVRDFQNEVTLQPSGDGTVIRTRVTFSPRIPGTGWIFESLIGAFWRKAGRRLAERVAGRAAEEQP
jgi:hypothetical protein